MTESGHHSRNGFLTRQGYRRVAQQTSLEGLAPRGVREYVDRVGSVSALVEPSEPIFVDSVIEEQHRRFLNGS